MTVRGETRRTAWQRAVTFGLALLAIAVLTTAQPAEAALGANADSVAADRAHVSGTLRSLAFASYDLHELETATGTVVREFVVPGGPVFAVTWEGPFLPDLRQLLGSSYEAYAQAARVKRRGRGPLVIQLPELVVESAGHPRAFHGRAFVPHLVPTDVAIETIR